MPRMTATESPPPGDYDRVLVTLDRHVRSTRAAARRAVNAEMIQLYRTIGRTILDQQAKGWTDEVIGRIGADLRTTFPDMAARSFSPSNLRSMCALAEAWPTPETAPSLDQLPWGHIRLLLNEVHDPQARDWYAVAAVTFGWSHDVLLNQIKAESHLRAPADPTHR